MPGCLVLVAPGDGFAAETGSAVIQSIGFPTANSHKGGFLFWLSSSKGERGLREGDYGNVPANFARSLSLESVDVNSKISC